MASPDLGLSGTRMVTLGLVGEFSGCGKDQGTADLRFLCCSRSTGSAASAPPCHSLSLSFGSCSHSSILFSLLHLHLLQQLPVTYLSFYELLPALRTSSSLLSSIFERRVAASTFAIAVLAIAATVCRESFRMRALMLSEPDLEKKPVSKLDWWCSFRRFCGVFRAKSFDGVLILA